MSASATYWGLAMLWPSTLDGGSSKEFIKGETAPLPPMRARWQMERAMYWGARLDEEIRHALAASKCRVTDCLHDAEDGPYCPAHQERLGYLREVANA